MSQGWGNDPWGDDWGSTRRDITIDLSINELTLSARSPKIYSRKTNSSLKRKYSIPDNIQNNIKTKVKLVFSKKVEGPYFDSRELNYEDYNLYSLYLNSYVRQLSPTSLHFREYGLALSGAIEIIVDLKYINWFKIADHIYIRDNEYEVFNNNVGSYATIRQLPLGRIAIVLRLISGTNIPFEKRDIFK